MPDIPSGTSTTAAFEGDPNFLATFSGQFEFFGDQDTIKVTLTTNHTYQFFASATQPGATNGDTVITLTDASGTVLVANDNAGGTANSAMTFFAVNSGTYYLTVGSHSPDTMGAYSVGVLGSGFWRSASPAEMISMMPSGSPQGLIVGDRGDDTIWLAAHNLHAFGEQGNDVILGTNEANSISGGLGDDVVSGSGGDDHLFGDAGDDEIVGWDGNDFIYGGAGIDIMRGDIGNDTMFGGADSDYLREAYGINVSTAGQVLTPCWAALTTIPMLSTIRATAFRKWAWRHRHRAFEHKFQPRHVGQGRPVRAADAHRHGGDQRHRQRGRQHHQRQRRLATCSTASAALTGSRASPATTPTSWDRKQPASMWSSTPPASTRSPPTSRAAC